MRFTARAFGQAFWEYHLQLRIAFSERGVDEAATWLAPMIKRDKNEWVKRRLTSAQEAVGAGDSSALSTIAVEYRGKKRRTRAMLPTLDADGDVRLGARCCAPLLGGQVPQ